MNKILLSFILSLVVNTVFAQKYLCKNGLVSFFSATPVENIEAKSNECSSALDSKTGDLVVVIPIKSFKFEHLLMQEHFNENYMESHKYPKAFFKGKIAGIESIDFSKEATHKVNAVGQLTIHNVTREVNIPGTISIQNGQILLDSKFDVRCADHNIKIPKLVLVKIAESIEVHINNSLSPVP